MKFVTTYFNCNTGDTSLQSIIVGRSFVGSPTGTAPSSRVDAIVWETQDLQISRLYLVAALKCMTEEDAVDGGHGDNYVDYGIYSRGNATLVIKYNTLQQHNDLVLTDRRDD